MKIYWKMALVGPWLQCCSALVKKLTALPLSLKSVKSNGATATATAKNN